MGETRKPAAILVSDIVGYTPLPEKHMRIAGLPKE
jgi:hypothetical protein